MWLGRAEKEQSTGSSRAKLLGQREVRNGSSPEECSNCPVAEALVYMRSSGWLSGRSTVFILPANLPRGHSVISVLAPLL